VTPGRGEGGTEIVEEVALGVEVGQYPGCGQDPSVLGTGPLDEDRDPPPIQLVDRVQAVATRRGAA
jgi:hypothetical protein